MENDIQQGDKASFCFVPLLPVVNGELIKET
jgi:hypothetical protein